MIVLSSHLDDAVLSASTALMSGARLITVFAGIPPVELSLTPWDRLTGATDSSMRMRERHDEDAGALRVLAPESEPTLRLPFLDVEYRTPLEQEIGVDDIVDALLPPADATQEILVPAALGNHPDHLLTRDAGLRVAAELGLRVVLYADVPYAVPYGWAASVSGTPDPSRVDRSGFLHEQFRDSGLDPEEWLLVPCALAPEQAERKRRALLSYASQIDVLDQCAARIVTRDEVLAFEARWVRRR